MADLAALPRWLYVSKAVEPPWHDGSVNLVRDLATHVRAVEAHIFTRDTALVGAVRSKVVRRAVKPQGTPAVLAAMRVLSPFRSVQAQVFEHLAFGPTYDGYHFVFAPNPRSSTLIAAVLGARRAVGLRRPVVQTIASAPLRFEGAGALLFGDVVVAQSEWTRNRLHHAGVRRALEVVPPCAAAPEQPSIERLQALRARLGLQDGPVFVYAGDYEVSSAAQTVAAAAARLVAQGAQVVFACRPKTPRSALIRDALLRDHAAQKIAERVLHAGVIDDMPALLATATALLFPVDDLYGKVDLPLVLLEAMALGTPLIVASGGPLVELSHVMTVTPRNADALASSAIALLRETGSATAMAARAKSVYYARYTPTVIAARYDDIYASLRR